MKTMMKPLRLIAAVIAAAVFIVFCSTLFWIKSNHGLEWMTSRINTIIPGEMTIDSHRLSLLKPSLELYGGVLHDPRGLAIAGFTRFSMELDWWALWRREIRLEAILLKAPWIDLTVDEAARPNLMAALVPPAREKETKAPTPDGPGLPFNIVCRSIQLTDGRFTYTPADGTTRLETTGIILSADGDLMARSGGLDLAITSVLFSSVGIHPQPARVRLKARLDGDTLRIPTVDVTSGQTTLKLSGWVDDLFTAPMVDSVLSVDSRLGDLKAAFDLDGDYSGPVNANITLKGSMANPDAGLVLSVDGGRIAGQPLDRGNLSLNLQDRRVTIDSVVLRLADGLVSLNGTLDLRQAFPTGFLAPPADIDAMAYALTLVQDTPNLNPWLNRFVDVTGRMTSRLSLSGKGVTPEGIFAALTLDGSGKELLAPGMDRSIHADVNLSARMERGRISISRLNATTDDVALSGKGGFQMAERTLAGKLSLTADDLSPALAVVGIPSVNGACKAALTVSGSLSQPQLSLDLAAKNLKVDTYTLGDLTIDADMDHDGFLNLHSLSVQNRSSRIHGNGCLRLLPNGGGIDPDFINSVDLTLEKVSAADFVNSLPFKGTVDGRLQLDGPMTSLKGALSLTGKALSTATATIGDVATRMRLDGGTIWMDRLHLRNQESTFSAAGSIQLLVPNTLHRVEDPSIDFSADSEHFDPGDFIDAASGNFTFNGKLAGTLEKPVGRITLNGRQADLAGQPIDSLALDARFQDRRLWLDRLLAAVAPGEQIQGSGWVDMDRTLELKLKSTGIPASRIQQLEDIFSGQGIIGFDVAASGSLDNPDVQGTLNVSEVRFNDRPIDDVNLAFSIHDKLARASGNLNFAVDAAYHLENGDFDARLIFDQTETGVYFKALGKPEIHGTLTGQVQAAGNIRDVANATANVDVNQLDVFFKETLLLQSDRIAAHLANQTFSIAEMDMAVLSTGNLRIDGEARLDGLLDIDVDGQIPLAAGEVFSADLADAQGHISIGGNLSGTAKQPQVDARIDLARIGMTVPGLVQKLHDLNGRIYLTGNTIRMDGLSGNLETGSFGLAGTIDHENFAPTRMNLAIDAKALPLEIPDTLDMLVNGDIKLTGEGRTANARGKITLLEGTYYKDVKINLLKLATTRRRTVTPAAKPLSIPFFETIDLDIGVGHRQPFMVDNNLAQLEISPDLKIGGRLDHPIVSGRAQVKSGTVTFQKKTFDVKKGVIDFVNPYQTEAEIDIQSETQFRTWKIKLAIKGNPDNLDILLSSDPPETDSDILSLILFGRTANELTAGTGSTKRTTGQIMAEMIADTFGEDIKKKTGVDILQVETNGNGSEAETEAVKVTIGKRLSDRMTVKYAVETQDGEITQRAISEYKLLENILLTGFQDTKGVYGSELVFRIEFR